MDQLSICESLFKRYISEADGKAKIDAQEGFVIFLVRMRSNSEFRAILSTFAPYNARSFGSLVGWFICIHLIVRILYQVFTICCCLWCMIFLVKNSLRKKPVKIDCPSLTNNNDGLYESGIITLPSKWQKINEQIAHI